MTDQWRKPTPDEQRAGIVAICIATESVRTYEAKGRFTGHRQPYLRTYHYNQERLERRASYDKENLPEWWTPQSETVQPLHDLETAFMEYLAGGEPSPELLAKLETMGSYAVTKAQYLSVVVEEREHAA